MLNFIHTTYGLAPYPVAKENTLLSGLHKPDYYCKNVEGHLILNDYNSLSGVVEYYKACKEHKKKVIIGCKFLDAEGKSINLVAKNLTGYKNLLNLVSRSNDSDRYNKRPVLHLDDVNPDGLISVVGGLYWDWDSDNYNKHVNKFEHVYIQSIPNLGVDKDVTEQFWDSIINVNDLHFHKKQHLEDFKVLLCAALRCRINKLEENLSGDDFIHSLDSYQRSDTIFSQTEQGFIDSIEDYEILRDASLPPFKWTDGMSEEDYLWHLCREGYRKKYKSYWDTEIYGNRVKKEMAVLLKYNLAGYTLIVQDYVEWAKNQGILVGCARGCLVNTNIVTSSGIKDISKVNTKDYVITKTGMYERVLNVFQYPISNEKLLKIDVYNGDFNGLTLTKDHKVLACVSTEIEKYNTWSNTTKKANKRWDTCFDEIEWIKASKLTENDWLFVPNIHHLGTKIEIDLSKYTEKYNQSHTYIENGFIKHKSASNKTHKSYIQSIPLKIELDNKLAYVLGVFTGDGWFSPKKKNRVSFCFHSVNNKKSQNLIIDFFNKYGCRILLEKHKSKQLLQMHIHSPVFYKLFTNMFYNYRQKSNTKHIPDSIFYCSKDIIESYMQGIIDSDGHINKYKTVITTVSKKLSYQIKLLLNLLNLPSSVRTQTRVDTRKDFTNTLPSYQNSFYSLSSYDKQESSTYVKFIKNGYFVKINKICEISNISEVYDIEVENESNYLTTSGIVHNSAASSLVSYLINTTEIDPVKNNLIFERYLNSGRFTEGHVEYPDIDVDFPPSDRERVVDYIREKYGEERVSQVVTFGRMMGASILTEVLSAHGAASFEQIKTLTKLIPNEAEIIDNMQSTHTTSVLQWMLEYTDKLDDYCIFRDDKYIGEFARYFEQAIRLEGTFKNQGKHAAGLVIAPESTKENCPMVYDKNTDHKIAGLDMDALKKIGFIKFDILGVRALEEIKNVFTTIKESK